MSSTLTTERRQSRRRKPPQLVYLEFGRENGGMIKDVSEGGMRFHLINPVAAGLSVHFAAAIDAVRRMEGQARMVWTDASGKSGGLCFTELSASSRDILQAWLAEIDGPEGVIEPTVAVPYLPAKAPEQSRSAPPTLPTPPVFAATPQVAAQRESPAAVLEVGSQFISQPVARELWQRAAREEIAPGERTRRPLAAAKAKAMHEEVRASSRGSALLETTHGESPALEPKAVETRAGETKSGEIKLVETGNGAATDIEDLAERVEPLRELRSSPSSPVVRAQAPTVDAIEPYDRSVDRNESVSKGWSTSRFAMIFALAAICGAAAAFAALAYRQNVGESLIKLGEKISGERRPAANMESDPPATATTPAADPGWPTGRSVADKARATNKKRSEVPAEPAANSSTTPAARQPITQQPITRQMDQPKASARQQVLPETVIGQTQLATGREIIPGKPSRPPEDVASLWIAVENGDTAAEILLANHYASGDGVEKNCDQARVLLQAAAKRGSDAAAKRLKQLADAGCQ